MLQVCEIIGLAYNVLNSLHRANIVLSLFIFKILQLFSVSNLTANSWSYAPDIVHDRPSLTVAQ